MLECLSACVLIFIGTVGLNVESPNNRFMPTPVKVLPIITSAADVPVMRAILESNQEQRPSFLRVCICSDSSTWLWTPVDCGRFVVMGIFTRVVSTPEMYTNMRILSTYRAIRWVSTNHLPRLSCECLYSSHMYSGSFDKDRRALPGFARLNKCMKVGCTPVSYTHLTLPTKRIV